MTTSVIAARHENHIYLHREKMQKPFRKRNRLTSDIYQRSCDCTFSNNFNLVVVCLVVLSFSRNQSHMGQKYATWLNKSKGTGGEPRAVNVAYYVSFYHDHTLRIRHVGPLRRQQRLPTVRRVINRTTITHGTQEGVEMMMGIWDNRRGKQPESGRAVTRKVAN